MTATGTRTHNHLVRKQTLNHLVKLASLTKWLGVRLQIKWLWVQITKTYNLRTIGNTRKISHQNLSCYCIKQFTHLNSHKIKKYYICRIIQINDLCIEAVVINVFCCYYQCCFALVQRSLKIFKNLIKNVDTENGIKALMLMMELFFRG